MKYQSVVEPTASTPAPSYSDRQFLHTYQSGAWLPLTQATITAFMAMVAAAVVLFMVDALDYVKPVVITGAVSWVATWLYLQRRWLTLTSLEQRLGRDLNGDQVIGKPEPEALKSIRVQVDTLEANGHIRQSQMFDLPLSEEELEQIAVGTARGLPFSEREWVGNGKPFSTNRFREMRSEFLKRGMLVPASSKSDRQGFVWTRVGRKILSGYAPELDDIHSPTPLEEAEDE